MLWDPVRRLVFGLVLTAVVAGLGAAMAPGAAARNVGARPCQENAFVQVSYSLVAHDPRYVTGIVLDDLSSVCAHAIVKVSLANEHGEELIRVQSRHNELSSQLSLELPSVVRAEDVHRVDVVVAGAKR